MPGIQSTDGLTSRRHAFIAERLPEPPQAPTGRPHYSNRDLLPGTGVRCRPRSLNGFSEPVS